MRFHTAAIALVAWLTVAAAMAGKDCSENGVSKTCADTASCCASGFQWVANPTVKCCPAGTKCCAAYQAGTSTCIPRDQECCNSGGGNQQQFWACNATQQCGTPTDKCVSKTITRRVCNTACAGRHGADAVCHTAPVASNKCMPANFTNSYNGYPQQVRSVMYSCAPQGGQLSVDMDMWTTSNCTGGRNGNSYIGPMAFDVQRCYADPSRDGGSFVITAC
jgi:hypothetical protein